MTKLEMMNLSQGLSNLYTGLETDLIANIADYLKSGDVSSSTAQWKIQMLAKLGALDKANIKTIAEYAGIAPDMLTEALESAALTAIEELEPSFQQLVKDGIINGTEIPIEKTMSKALTTYNKQARQSLNMVNTVMRFKAKSAAQKVINDTAELAGKQSFVDMLNKAAGKAVTGAESRQAAMRQCIKDMSDKGIPAFVDKLGREWSPEAYINMDIRTTVSNTANQAQFDRMEAYGLNLVGVSSHSGARPKCAKDQGKIFNRNGKGGYTTDLHGKKIRYYAWSDSSNGEPDGLLGINCGHHIYPFIPGVSYQTYFPTDEKENNEQYMKVQGQRELERRVRKSKRECTALEAVGDTEGLKKASAVLQNRQRALKKYCTDNGLSYKADRTAFVGYNRTVAGKVNSVNRKTASESNHRKIVDKTVSNGIIKKNKEFVEKLDKLKESKINESDYNEYLKIINNHYNQDITKLYKNYADKISKVNYNPSGGAYQSSTNSLDFSYPQYTDMHKYGTLAHEYGHFFDRQVKYNGLHFKEISAIRNATGLNSVFEIIASSSDEFLTAIRKDKVHIRSILTTDAIKDLAIHNASHGVQDAIDGLFSKSRIRWGHGEKYYNRKYANVEFIDKRTVTLSRKKALQQVYKDLGFDASNQTKVKMICRQYEAASEAWANIMSAEVCNGESLEYVKKYLPNSYQAMLEILKGVH